jgi:hypothetical protein
VPAVLCLQQLLLRAALLCLQQGLLLAALLCLQQPPAAAAGAGLPLLSLFSQLPGLTAHRTKPVRFFKNTTSLSSSSSM